MPETVPITQTIEAQSPSFFLRELVVVSTSLLPQKKYPAPDLLEERGSLTIFPSRCSEIFLKNEP
jgi:hypothetical protein